VIGIGYLIGDSGCRSGRPKLAPTSAWGRSFPFTGKPRRGQVRALRPPSVGPPAPSTAPAVRRRTRRTTPGQVPPSPGEVSIGAWLDLYVESSIPPHPPGPAVQPASGDRRSPPSHSHGLYTGGGFAPSPDAAAMTPPEGLALPCCAFPRYDFSSYPRSVPL